MVPASAIDDDLASGLDDTKTNDDSDKTSVIKALIGNKYLMVFALLAALFHLSNAAMLTSVGQLLTHLSGKDNATSLVALCIVAAQLVMVPVAVIVGHRADRWGRKPIFLVAFAVLAIRGVLYTFSDSPAYLVAVQCLDGIGAGIYGALFPLVVDDLTRGTGRFNVGPGRCSDDPGARRGPSRRRSPGVIIRLRRLFRRVPRLGRHRSSRLLHLPRRHAGDPSLHVRLRRPAEPTRLHIRLSASALFREDHHD